jgi:hypothetical protein
MKKLILFSALLFTAFAASARPGHGGTSHGTGTPNNSFGQTTASEARAHSMSGKEQSAAAKTKATEKQQMKQAEKIPPAGPAPTTAPGQ